MRCHPFGEQSHGSLTFLQKLVTAFNPGYISKDVCRTNNLERQTYCLALGQRMDLFSDQYNRYNASLWGKDWACSLVAPCKNEDTLSLVPQHKPTCAQHVL